MIRGAGRENKYMWISQLHFWTAISHLIIEQSLPNRYEMFITMFIREACLKILI